MKIAIKKIIVFIAATLACGVALSAVNPDAKLHKFSTTIEKKRPQLDAETKSLIAAYRKSPTEANRAALEKKVADNYDKVIARKKAKLEELKRTAREASKVKEMQDIVDEMIASRSTRIERTMKRFADPRLRPNARSTKDGFLPVLGAGNNVDISRTLITNAQFGEFLKASGAKSAKVVGGANHPAVNVSYADAVAFCKWMTKKDGRRVYRLPTETEWEFAAGHMPKDADFNCGERNGTSDVEAYQKTLSACGAVDMWGNCWEWTSTEFSKNGEKLNAVKGGSFDSKRTECRTELKGVGRNPAQGYHNVGFRVVRVDRAVFL